MMEDLQIRNYAPSTVKAYVHYVRGVADFAKHFGKSPDLLGAEQIREYQLFLIKEKGIALPTYIQIVSGLRPSPLSEWRVIHSKLPRSRLGGPLMVGRGFPNSYTAQTSERRRVCRCPTTLP
jgi:hypothetical protein